MESTALSLDADEVKDMKIYLNNSDADIYLVTTVDGNGSFYFGGIPAGTYDLMYELNNSEVTLEVVLVPGENEVEL